MIKRIILDVDDTVIKWEDRYWYSINLSLDELGIHYNKTDVMNFKRAINDYEKVYDTYSKSTMLELINKYSNLNLPPKFMDVWIYHLSKCVPENVDVNLIKTLEYLSNKYELVALTNWFRDQQRMRLENMNISKYFQNIIGVDGIKNKPDREPFEIACGEHSYQECVSVGDNYNVDIKTPLEMGMNAIWLTQLNDERPVTKINKIDDLIHLL